MEIFMAKLKILKVGDETLRKVSRPVDTVTPRIRTLLDDMIETMRAANGVGLAAPQIGVLRRVSIISSRRVRILGVISSTGRHTCLRTGSSPVLILSFAIVIFCFRRSARKLPFCYFIGLWG